MHTFKKHPRKIISIFGIILTTLVMALLYVHIINQSKNKNLLVRIISGTETDLSTEMRQWISNVKDKKGVYIYSVENDTSYELIMSHKEHVRNDLYIHSKLDATFKDGILQITINDEPANNDTDVQYNLKAYIQLPEKPKQTEVHVNGELQFLNAETGNFSIFVLRN